MSFNEASGSLLSAVAGSPIEDKHECGRDHSPAEQFQSERDIGLLRFCRRSGFQTLVAG